MLQLPTQNYTHRLPGWAQTIARLLTELEAATGPHKFRIDEIKEKYGSLRVEIEPADTVPAEVVAAAEKLVAEAEEKSECICIDCGVPAMQHEWNMHWIVPCCPAHARARAMAATKYYSGLGWRLTPDFEIVDEAGLPLSSAKIRALDLAATRQERRKGRAVVIGPRAADWRAARWMAS